MICPLCKDVIVEPIHPFVSVLNKRGDEIRICRACHDAVYYWCNRNPE